MGGTLTRLSLLTVTETTVVCRTHEIGPVARQHQCDACPGKHSPKRITCSMNTGATAWHEPGALYDFCTRRRMANWRLLDTSQPRGSYGVQTWAPPPGDKTHRDLITQAAS